MRMSSCGHVRIYIHICVCIYDDNNNNASLVQWLEYAVPNGVARVRFPDDAYHKNMHR